MEKQHINGVIELTDEEYQANEQMEQVLNQQSKAFYDQVAKMPGVTAAPVVKQPGEETNEKKGPVMYGRFSPKCDLDLIPDPLESFGSISRVRASKLAVTIKEKLRVIFPDLFGVIIRYGFDPSQKRNKFFTSLLFQENASATENNPATVKSVVNLSKKTDEEKANKNNVWYTVQRMKAQEMNNMFTINDETRFLLSTIMEGGKNSPKNKPESALWRNKIDVNDYESHLEVMTQPVAINNGFQIQMRNTAQQVIIQVNHIDLEAVLRKVYGKEIVFKTEVDENNEAHNFTSEAIYHAEYKGHINQYDMYINIETIAVKQVLKLASEEQAGSYVIGGIQYW